MVHMRYTLGRKTIPVDSPGCGNLVFEAWASTAARWRISAATPRRRKWQAGARPMLKCLRMSSA